MLPSISRPGGCQQIHMRITGAVHVNNLALLMWRLSGKLMHAFLGGSECCWPALALRTQPAAGLRAEDLL